MGEDQSDDDVGTTATLNATQDIMVLLTCHFLEAVIKLLANSWRTKVFDCRLMDQDHDGSSEGREVSSKA